MPLDGNISKFNNVVSCLLGLRKSVKSQQNKK